VIENIFGNLYFVERGWLNANHFVFNGTNKVLIDTGYKKHLDDTFYLIRKTGLNPAKVRPHWWQQSNLRPVRLCNSNAFH